MRYTLTTIKEKFPGKGSWEPYISGIHPGDNLEYHSIEGPVIITYWFAVNKFTKYSFQDTTLSEKEVYKIIKLDELKLFQ